jgi:hypothetical protein
LVEVEVILGEVAEEETQVVEIRSRTGEGPVPAGQKMMASVPDGTADQDRESCSGKEGERRQVEADTKPVDAAEREDVGAERRADVENTMPMQAAVRSQAGAERLQKGMQKAD